MTDATTPTPTPTPEEKPTDLSELSDQGVGATLGEKDTFEPEESQGSPE